MFFSPLQNSVAMNIRIESLAVAIGDPTKLFVSDTHTGYIYVHEVPADLDIKNVDSTRNKREIQTLDKFEVGTPNMHLYWPCHRALYWYQAA